MNVQVITTLHLLFPRKNHKKHLDSSVHLLRPKGTNPFTVPQNTNLSNLIGGWTNPSEKYAQVKLDHETPNRDETKKIFETTTQKYERISFINR